MRRLIFIAAIVFLIAAYFSGGKKIFHGTYHSSRTAKQAISYARKQLGKAYLWGGEGPWVFDCSGLTFRAWNLPDSQRTSQAQWASEQHVSHPRPGDLVYFHGVLIGNEKPPGHVGIVVGKNKMIDAYGQGTQVRVESFGRTDSAPGLQDVMGYTRP